MFNNPIIDELGSSTLQQLLNYYCTTTNFPDNGCLRSFILNASDTGYYWCICRRWSADWVTGICIPAKFNTSPSGLGLKVFFKILSSSTDVGALANIPYSYLNGTTLNFYY